MIQSCVFNISNRNANFIDWDVESDTTLTEFTANVQNEGMVLFLNNFNGPISILSSSFVNLVTVQRDTTAECALDSVDTQDLKTNPKQSVFIDKMVKNRLENDGGSLRFTGSILNIRNLRLGLAIKDCVFSDNVGFTGVGLFLHQFDISAGSNPLLTSTILIENNIFTRNFAYRYGLSLVIFNNEKDYVNIAKRNKCSGIQINGNTFQDNAGCPKAFGNVILSCFPADISTKSSPYNSYDTLTTVSTSTYNMVYSFGFTSSSSNFNQASDATYSFQTLLAQMFSTPLPQQSNVTMSVPPSPETPVYTRSIDINTVNVYDNVFINNYAIVNNALFMSGTPSAMLINNTFQNNSIAADNSQVYVVTSLAKNIFKTPTISYVSGLTVTETSALMIGLAIKLTIKDSVFSNNSGILNSNYHIGLAITLNNIIPVNLVLIQNCSFKNHLSSNNQSLLSVNYKEYFNGLAFTTQSQHPSAGYFYLKSFQGNLTLISCQFISNYFKILNFANIDQNTAAILSFYTEYTMDSSFYHGINSYSSESSYTPASDYILMLSDMIFSDIQIPDGRPLINIFYNNLVTMRNFQFKNVVLSDVLSNSGFIVLYLLDNSFDFSYQTYQISIYNISASNSQGAIVNIYHPIQKNPSVVNGALNITNFYITNHQTFKAPIWLGENNVLWINNITMKTVTTMFGVLGFQGAQQSASTSGTTWLFVTNVTAIYVSSYKYAGLYLYGMYNCEFTNISITQITFIFSDSLSQQSGSYSVCLYAALSLPYISNFSCSNIQLSNITTKYQSLLSGSSFGICLNLQSISKNYSKNGRLPISNSINCQLSKGPSNFDPAVYSIYLAVISATTNLYLTNISFTQHLSLYGGIYLYSCQNIVFSNFVLSNLQVLNSLSGSLAVILSGLSSLSISNSSFTENYCQTCSGTIQVTEISLLKIYTSNITNNTALDAAGILVKGASECQITDTVVLGNFGTNGTGMLTSYLSTMTIFRCSFIENNGYINGMKFVETLFSIKSSKFYSNYAFSKSSNIYVSVNSVSSLIWDCLFSVPPDFFIMTPISSQKGNFIFINEAVILIQYCSFINGYSSQGGAIYYSASSTKSLSIENSKFYNNTATDYGGAVYIVGLGSIISSGFYNNSCSGLGSNFYIGVNSLVSINDTFMNNSVETSVYMDQKAALTIGTSTFQGLSFGNSSVNGLYCMYCSSISIEYSSFYDFRQVNREGAGLIVVGLTSGSDYDDSEVISFILSNSSVKNCSSNQGSALYLLGRIQANLTGSVFDSNLALRQGSDDSTGKGGALYFNATNLYASVYIFSKNSFINNRADIAGGAHYFSLMPIIFLDSTTIYRNNSAVYGNNQASYAVSIEYTADFRNLQILSAEYYATTSGSIIIPYITVHILDEFGQVVSSDNSSYLI